MSLRVRSSKMRVFSSDRYIFRIKFPTGFTYRHLHGFARFPGDSTALVRIRVQRIYEDGERPATTAWTSWHTGRKCQEKYTISFSPAAQYMPGDLSAARSSVIRSYALTVTLRPAGASGHVTVVSRSSEIVLAPVNNSANFVRGRGAGSSASGPCVLATLLFQTPPRRKTARWIITACMQWVG